MYIFDIKNLFFIMPEIILLSGASIILVLNLFLNKKSLAGYGLSQLLLIITLIATFSLIGIDTKAFDGSIKIDDIAIYSKIFILVFSIAVFQYTKEYLVKMDEFKNEYFSLMLFSILGMMIMSSSSNLISMYLGLEIMSLTLYSLIAMANTRVLAIEAALKYFILGAIASGILLYGMSLLYGATGSLDIATIAHNSADANPLLINFAIVFLLIGIAFKFGAVPFHMWVPDVYQGAILSSTMFLSSVPKIATSLMFVRVITEALDGSSDYWGEIVMFLGVFSVIVGTVIALIQTNIKRLLAYSTIAHIGFILVAFSLGTTSGYSSAIYYMVIYAITTIAAFGILIAISSKDYEIDGLSSLSGLFKDHPIMAFAMLIVMFSMAGIPPMIGFYAKLSILQEVMASSHILIATILVIFAVIGAYYYLRIIKFMFFDKPQTDIKIHNSFITNLFLAVNVLALLFVGLFPDYLTTIIRGLL
jgi:NADH-quinone oxidoreductase subunit N